jgi:hypothetical protein
MLDPADLQRVPAGVRDRIALKIVEPGRSRRFVIPHQHGEACYRGCGGADYACGSCGTLLAIGVRPGMFRSFAFACPCGTLNAVD